METVNIAVVEDDNKMQTELVGYLNEFFKKQCIKYTISVFSSAEPFLDLCDGRFSVVFMDIELPGMNGMKAIEQIRQKDSDIAVIFITYLAQYALQGYKVNAFDYIVKPITKESLYMTLNRLAVRLDFNGDNYIMIESGKTTRRVLISSLKYIEVQNHKLVFHTLSGDFKIKSNTIKYWAEKLKDFYFAFCNISFLVNLKYVTEIKDDFVELKDIRLPISRPKKKDFILAVAQYFGQGGGKDQK